MRRTAGNRSGAQRRGLAVAVIAGVGGLGALGALGGAARAQPPDDAYCDHAEAVASSESAILMGPELFGTLGYIEATDTTTVPASVTSDPRFIGGVRLKLGGFYQGLVTRDHARADCRRHLAIDQVAGASAHVALEAKAKVLDDALPQAQKYLAEASADLEARRANAQDVTATRLRVEELRQLADDARQQLAALPPATGPLAGALAAYYAADADVERDEGKLRAAQGWDVSVRLGVSEFLNRDNPSPFFASITGTFNVGWLFEGGANGRAAAARAKLVREPHADQIVDATVAQLQATLAAETKREADTRALVGDLARQLEELKGLGGEQPRRYRETVWFEWVKASADHEYLAAHVASLREVLGERGDGGAP